jgi:hypothetical protein
MIVGSKAGLQLVEWVPAPVTIVKGWTKEQLKLLAESTRHPSEKKKRKSRMSWA